MTRPLSNDIRERLVSTVDAGVNGGGNMYRGGGAKMMEWTPPPDGICMCQGGVVVRPPEGGGIRGTGYHRRD